MNGTRRMWSRRVLRAGWLIAPIFTFPGKAFNRIKEFLSNLSFDSRGKFTLNNVIGPLIGFGLICFFCGLIGFMAHDLNKYSDNASVKDMKEAAAANECVGKALMEQLSENRTVKRFHLEQMENKCEDERATAEQYRALTEQREALHAK